jgi:cell division protein FtsZ
MAEIKPEVETFAKIKVIGVGGGGGSAINRMIDAGIRGVDFVAVNTDVQALYHSKANEKIHIGKGVTRGLGAGMNPDLGRQAAEESQNDIRESLKNCDMVFITCGMGGGTGTGASPLIAEIARDLGALTVAVVTKPFTFEGGKRRELADRGYEELADKVDTIISISNDKLLHIIDKKTSLLESFAIADNVLRQGVQGIAEIITVPGIINTDFADVKAVMSNAGSALMGIGHASGENKAIEAAKMAINSSLLDMSIDGASGVVFTITGGPSLSMNEVNESAKLITAAADDEAKIIFGAVIDEKMKDDEIKITVVATGFDNRMKMSRSNEGLTGTPSSPPSSSSSAGYTPNPFIEAEGNRGKEDDSKSWLGNKDINNNFKKAQEEPVKQVDNGGKKDINDEFDEEELSVPAFIRKKMGN